MSSQARPPSLPPWLDALLRALPMAAALCRSERCGADARSAGARQALREPEERDVCDAVFVAGNAHWRAFWAGHEPSLMAEAPGGPAALGLFTARLVDPLAADRLAADLALGRALDRRVAVDRDGPELVHCRGCLLGDHYLLLIEPVPDPWALAADWPGAGASLERPQGFCYTAALGVDGRFRISASWPDFRLVLGLDGAAEGWLDDVAPADRLALRSRIARLFAGEAAVLRYRLRRDHGPPLLVEDKAVALRHPASGEVIGLVGWLERLAAADDEAGSPSQTAARAGSPAGQQRPAASFPPRDGVLATAGGHAPAGDLEPVLDTLEALGSTAMLLDLDGHIVAAGREAAALLGMEREQLRGQRIDTVLQASLDGGMEDDGSVLDASGMLAQAEAEGASAETPGDALRSALLRAAAAADAQLPSEPIQVAVADPMSPRGSGAAPALRLTIRRVALDRGAPGGAGRLLLTLDRDRPFDNRVRDALYFDEVTGLPNRFLFLDRLRQSLARNAAAATMLAVLVLEVERLALIERSFGRRFARELLAALAKRLAGALGPLDTAARLADTRLAVLAGRLGGSEDAARIAQTVLDQFTAPVQVAGREIGVAGSIGIAVFPDDATTADELVRHAEDALDQVKPGEAPRFRFYTGAMNTASSDRLHLEQQLLGAIERDEFLLLYQPQISFASSRIVGMEALIRWRHPELGMVPPGDFIPLAEDTGIIVAIGEWVLETACRELQRWFAAGTAPLRLAINISGRQYNDANLVPGVKKTLEATGFPPHLLELELTESVIMEDVVDAAKRLGDLHRLGINLAVDDFGTGYSSLSYLKRFPIRSLKVDRSFVRDIAHSESSAAIARAIIAFGSALGLKVIAEGVESHDQYDILRGCGCDELQGYLFSRPVSAEDARMLATERRHLPLVRA